MARVLIEHNDLPAVIVIEEANEVLSIKYIAACLNREGEYGREDFSDLGSAFSSQQAKGVLGFVFVEVEYIGEDKLVSSIWRLISYENSKLSIESTVYYSYQEFHYFLEFSDERVDIAKSFSESRNKDKVFKTFYLKSNEKDWYELMPGFYDDYLEILFILNVLVSKPIISTADEFEAYLLQSKIRYDERQRLLK